MKTYNWEGVNPDGYFLDKLEPIPSALPSCQKLFQVSAAALSFFFQAEDGIRDLQGDWSSDVCSSDLASRDAALCLGLGLPGDTVLYLLLPLHAADFGVGLPEAGVLLAANRLVRIAGYGWAARGYER